MSDIGSPDAGGQSNDSNHARGVRCIPRPCGSYIRELPQAGSPAFYICLRAGSKLIPKDACIYFIRMSRSSFVLPTAVHPFPLVRDARRKAPQVVKWSLSVDPHRPCRRRSSRPEPRSWIGPWPQAPPPSPSCLTTVNENAAISQPTDVQQFCRRLHRRPAPPGPQL